jgi:peptidyl-prolyl cis-trans isomerase C
MKLMQAQIVGMLIDDILMKQYLAANAPPVPAADVERQFGEMVASMEKSGQKLADYCRQTGTTEDGIRKEITARMQWAAYGLTRLTEDELQKYYTANKDYFDGNTVRVSHVFYRLQIGITEPERAQALAQMTQLRNDIVAGKIDFAEAARKYSQCPSKDKGGDLEYIQRKLVVEENFARTAFGLAVGQVSEVVQTEFGLHIIKVTDRKPGQGSDYAKVKDNVRQLYMGELWEVILVSQRKAAKVEINLP